MRIFKLMCLFFVIIISLSLLGCQKSDAKEISAPIVDKGAIDLSNWDFDKDVNIKLDGQWEFYWNELLTFNDLHKKSELTPFLGELPMAWTEYKINDEFLPGQGFGTYRLHVKTALSANDLMSIRVNNFSNAYRVFINDKEVASNGKVSSLPEEYKPGFSPLIATFTLPASEFDIIIQIANYEFYKGGFWHSIYISNEETIDRLDDTLLGKELFILGSLLIIVFYYLVVFVLIGREKFYLYFAIICFLAIIIVDSLGEILVFKLFPDMPFAVFIFGWYFATQWIAYFLILYVGELFPVRFNKTVSRIFGALTASITLFFLLTPVAFYTKFGFICDCVMVTGAIYSIFIAIIGLKQKKQGALLYIIAVGIMLLTGLHDVLFLANIIRTPLGEITFIGVFTLLSVHIFMHAKRFTFDYQEKKRLLIEVESTKEEAIENEIKFLQAQIKPHFLYNTLSVIASLIAIEPNEARRIIVKLGDYLRSSIDFDRNDNCVPIRKEIELVANYVEIEKARFRNKITFVLNCPDMPSVYIPRLSIQPLVENAIRHGILKKSRGGTVVVNINKEEKNLEIEIIDNGVGMTKELAENLLMTSFNTHGVGVKNIQARLIHLYGRGLTIESNLKKGTKISFFVPLTKDSEV